MEYFFTYELFKSDRVVRKGKGHCPKKSARSVEQYLNGRYRRLPWDRFKYVWHSSESAAFKEERKIIDGYVRVKGALPPWNSVRGGGGGQTYVPCKALTAHGVRCSNLALAGNYGFCGNHRR